MDNMRAVERQAEGAMSEPSEPSEPRPTDTTPSGFSRRVHGFSIGRRQRNCAACGRYLPMTWPQTAELCQACQDKATPVRNREADR